LAGVGAIAFLAVWLAMPETQPQSEAISQPVRE
jgi:predicted MFS family arabinose efflux permease